MPNAQEILRSLQSIANNHVKVAILWHIVFYLALVLFISSWRPNGQLFVLILALPLLSVALFAWIAGNPFNGTLFSLLAVLVIVFGLKTSPEPVAVAAWPYLVIGMVMVVFGLVYPHFLQTESVFKYLYASPAGLIPCPTLSIVIGLLLIFNGTGFQSFSLALVIFGLFYGFFGVFKLGVRLDSFLIMGVITLLIKYLSQVGKAI